MKTRVCALSMFFLVFASSLSCINGQLSGDLRLVSNFGSTRGSSGKLEVYYSDQWGTVCDNRFGVNDAKVACRQLGFSDYSQYGTVGRLGFRRASFSTKIWLNNLRCSGSESRLINCPANTIGNEFEDCSHSQDIALFCSRTQPWNGALRLVTSYGSTGGSSGRLEIYYNNTWGTVCSNQFGRYDADVACKQLGYTRGYCWGRVGLLRASSQVPIWLDNLRSNRKDISLLNCSHSGVGDTSCSHYYDVAISCSSIHTCRGTRPPSNGRDDDGSTVKIGTGSGLGSVTMVGICLLCCCCCAYYLKSSSSSSYRSSSSNYSASGSSSNYNHGSPRVVSVNTVVLAYEMHELKLE